MPTLRWLTRDQDVRATEKVPYRLLEEVPSLGYGDRDTGNMLIQGDNLAALKSLLPFYAGQVKCIYIDPPYNTGSAFEHYDDNLQHSQWLAMMWPRLELLRELLAEDGSIWVTVDDSEGHYLKVIMDELFGRSNFVSSFAWEKDQGRRGDTDISSAHDHVLLYAADRKIWRKTRNLLDRTPEQIARYRNPDNDPRGPWLQGDNGTAKSGGESSLFSVKLPSGREVLPPKGNFWRFSQENFAKARSEGRVHFGAKGDSMPVIKRYLTDVQQGIVPRTWWPADETGTNQSAKRDHLRKLLPEIEPFGTPKPEELLQRILQIATNPGDLVLDSFLGSGTTAAVAQKMGRRFIGIEMGDHAVTHCQPRLSKVVDGEQGGISKAQNWQGGGGFRFYRLGAAVFDETGGLQPDIRFATLAAHIWFSEMAAPWNAPQDLTPFLGASGGRGIALLYNGILGDKSLSGGNVLNLQTLRVIRAAAGDYTGALIVYGERTLLSPATLEAEGLTFKQTPYDVRARK